MATDKPKVSAYVPQPLKDRLGAFRKERNDIRESKALTIILAEYFEMEHLIDRASEGIGGVTLARMESLEEKLADFTKFVETRFQQLEETIRTLGESPVVQREEDFVASAYDVVPLSELPNESLTQGSEPERTEVLTFEDINNGSLPSELYRGITEPEGIQDDVSSTLEQENTQQQQQSDKNEQDRVEDLKSDVEKIDRPILSLLSEPPGNDILESVSPKLLGIRFGVVPTSITVLRGRYSPEKFHNWTVSKDPDKIAWKYMGKGKGYLPDGELSSEQESELLEWLQNNSTN